MVYDEGALLDVFAEASTRTQAAHKKLAIKLQKIAITQQPEFFVKTFRDNLLRVLSIKKGIHIFIQVDNLLKLLIYSRCYTC